MWPGKRRNELVLYLGPGQLECYARTAGGKHRECVAAVPIAHSGDAQWDFALDALLERALSARAGADYVCARVLVSDRWLRWAALPWSDALLRPASAAEYCSAAGSASFGGADDLADKSVYAVDDMPYGQPRVAAVMPATLRRALVELAQRHRVEIVSIRPLSVGVLRGASTKISESSFVLCIAEPGHLALCAVDKGRIGRVGIAAFEGGWTDSALRHWRRLRLREPEFANSETLYAIDLTGETAQTDVPEQIRLVTGMHPADFTRQSFSALDFRPSGCRGTRLNARSVTALALCASSLIFAGHRGLSELQQNRTVHAQLESAVGAEVRSWTGPKTLSRDEAVKVDAVNAAIRQLNVPIFRLLEVVQPPDGLGVALLGLDLTGQGSADDGGVLTVSAEGRTSADMTAYVAYLAERAPVMHAYLTRHETVAESSGPYRFTVTARWHE